MLKNEDKMIQPGNVLSIKPQKHSCQLFYGFLCTVSQISGSNAYKTLKKLTCTVTHPSNKSPGQNVTIYFDPNFPENGFLKKDVLMPVKISQA